MLSDNCMYFDLVHLQTQNKYFFKEYLSEIKGLKVKTFKWLLKTGGGSIFVPDMLNGTSNTLKSKLVTQSGWVYKH